MNDLVQAHRLYLDHGGEHLPLPDPDDLLDALGDRRLFGCWDDQGRLLAIGGLFLVARCCRQDRIPVAVYELAGMVVHPDGRQLRPFSLQDILVAVRVATFRLQQDSHACLISSVAMANSGSNKSMKRCGLVELDHVPPWLLDLRRTWMAGQRPAICDYIVPPTAVPGLEQLVRAAHGSSATRHDQKTGQLQQFSVELSSDAAFVHVLTSGSRVPPLWESDVPPIRLLGREPPFITWP